MSQEAVPCEFCGRPFVPCCCGTDPVHCWFCGSGKGPKRTYEISADRRSIRCLVCGLASHNPNDVANLYCGNCHKFHDK